MGNYEKFESTVNENNGGEALSKKGQRVFLKRRH